MNILLVTGMMKMFFGWSPTIIAGVIAFIGAIIGGAITLFGVQLSIQHNVEMKSKEELPNKIKYIENALGELNEVIKSDLDIDPGDREAKFISIKNTSFEFYELGLPSNFKKLTETLPESIKDNFIYIDADAYQMYLSFRKKVKRLGAELESEAAMMVNDLNRERKDDAGWHLLSTNLGRVMYLEKPKNLESNSTTEKVVMLYNTLLQMDREFSFELEMIYKELYTELKLKHKQLIKELDY